MILPDIALQNHVAVLGKTGSGKTSTAKLIIEEVVAAGARVCILDPIKSDWWGLTSSADGKRAGLPFHILGGPHKHVTIHEQAGAAIAEIVATAALPLSIIDMSDFGAGGQVQFFAEFAPALMRKMRGVLYLVIEEAHLFAPKERSGLGHENMAIHWAKLLATAGRTKGIRLIVVTQRTQSLHNALLGSCETLIAHRFTTPADQDPIKKWLKANVSKDIFERVSDSLASLRTGTGWVCSGEAKIFEHRSFPRITTYDNTATPTDNSHEHVVTTAPVDLDRLSAIIGAAVKEAEANDPKRLRAEIARLQGEVQKTKAGGASQADIVTAELRGRYEGAQTFARKQIASLNGLRDELNTKIDTAIQVLAPYSIETAPTPDTTEATVAKADALAPGTVRFPDGRTVAVKVRSLSFSGPASVTWPSPTVRKILDVIHRSYPVALSFDAASLRAGVSRRSSAYRQYRQQVEASAEIVRRDDGRFQSAPGYATAVGPGVDPIEEFAGKLPPSYAAMLRAIAGRRHPISREDIAAAANVSPTSSGLGSGLRALMALSLIERDGDRYRIHRDLRDQ